MGSTTQRTGGFQGLGGLNMKLSYWWRNLQKTSLRLSYSGRAYLAIAYEWGTKCNVLVRAHVNAQLGNWQVKD
jgi:hypothetical protein